MSNRAHRRSEGQVESTVDAATRAADQLAADVERLIRRRMAPWVEAADSADDGAMLLRPFGQYLREVADLLDPPAV